jgi:GT2 family glycosyltransferase
MPDALIITVNYKGADATEGFLESVSTLEGSASTRILVVENGSQDGSVERLRPMVQRFGNVELLESPVNRGYFGGANWALQQYKSRGHQPDWVIVCNNDITFDDRRFLSMLLQRDPGRGAVIAPAIIARQTGADCNPFLQQRPSRFQLLRYRFWQSNYYLMWLKQWLSPYVRILRHRRSSQRRDSKPTESSLVYAPHGAFLIFSRTYFEAGGYIDDGFFLYAEEFSVAEICRNLNLQVIHDPGLRVLHDAHRVTGRMCNRDSYAQGRDGFKYALQKYFLTPNTRGSQ